VTKPKEKSKLSKLGQRVEKLLEAQLKAIESDIAACAKDSDRIAKFSITDLNKVLDRALKLEAIRNKVEGDVEGGFYNQPRGADDEDE